MDDVSVPPDHHLLRLLVHVRDSHRSVPEGTRRTIIGEAMSLFTQLGYGGTSMRAIASAVGVQAGSLYAHFPQGKQQILFEGLQDICDEVLAHISAPLTPAMSTHEQFETLIRQHVSWQLDNGMKGLAWHAAFGGLGVYGAMSADEQAQIKASRRLYHDYLAALVAELGGPENARPRAQATLTLCDNAHRLRPTRDAPSTQVADLVVEMADRIIGVTAAAPVPS